MPKLLIYEKKTIGFSECEFKLEIAKQPHAFCVNQCEVLAKVK